MGDSCFTGDDVVETVSVDPTIPVGSMSQIKNFYVSERNVFE